MLSRVRRVLQYSGTHIRRRHTKAGFSTTGRQNVLPNQRLAAAVGAVATVGAALAWSQPFDADGPPTKLLTWGSDLHGQLGVCSGGALQSPTQVSSSAPNDIKSVHAAGLTTGLLTDSGDIYTFGGGSHGRLGHGATASNVTVPQRVAGIPKRCAALSVGENHIAAITADGELYTAGRQMRGSLGHPDDEKGKPALVLGALEGKRVVSVACGTKHTLAATADGKVFAFGVGRTLALGQGTDKKNVDSPTLVKALEGEHVVQVEAGNGFSVALTRDGTVYTWGANDYGQLGRGSAARYLTVGKVPFERKISTLSAGDLHVLALSSDGVVYAFGNGGNGRTGLGNEENTSSPQKVSGLAENVTQIAAGGAHSIAVTRNNKIFTWGQGRNGQLGQGKQMASVAAYRTKPIEINSVGVVASVAAGKDHSCVVVNADDTKSASQ